MNSNETFSSLVKNYNFLKNTANNNETEMLKRIV